MDHETLRPLFHHSKRRVRPVYLAIVLNELVLLAFRDTGNVERFPSSKPGLSTGTLPLH